MSSSNPRIERSWSQLPIELLAIISRNLTEIADYIAFRSACSSWRSSASLGALPPQLPRLFLPYDPDTGLRSFYNLATGKLSTFDLPECRNKFVCGSAHGWLALIADDSSISLWNPVTRSQISLPSPAQLPDYLGPAIPRRRFPHKNFSSNDEHSSAQTSSYPILRGYPWKVFLSSNPTDPMVDCIVVVVLAETCDFVYCSPGDETWSILLDFLPWPIFSVAFHDRRIYALRVDWKGVVLDLDAGPSLLPLSIPPPSEYVMVGGLYFLKGDAELFVALNLTARDGENNMEIFRLDLNGELEWSRVRSVGDLAFFLAGNHYLAVRAPGFPGCRPDCAYFSDHSYFRGELEPGVHDIVIYSLNENGYEYLSCPWEGTGRELRNSTWFTPSLC